MKENVSAMMDGELADHECDQCVARFKADQGLRAETWDLYHLIGDALRGHAGPAVIDGVRRRLAVEPVVLAPPRASAVRPSRRPAWYALSAAASVAAVGLVGWLALPQFDFSPATSSTPQVASVVETAPATATVPPPEGVADYLLAHQRFSPSSQMGGIAPYVRTVAEEARR
jgi:sigma-E factor negative regulatory protein RseA